MRTTVSMVANKPERTRHDRRIVGLRHGGRTDSCHGGPGDGAVAAHLRWPRRSDGAVALSLSDAMPTAMVARPHASAAAMRRIAIPEPALPVHSRVQRVPISVPAASAVIPSVARSIVAYAPPIFGPILEIARGALPSGAGVVMILSWIRLRRARRHWRRNRIEGQELWVVGHAGTGSGC